MWCESHDSQKFIEFFQADANEEAEMIIRAIMQARTGIFFEI